MDALQWMGPVRMRVQTANKNIAIIHKYSTWWVYQVKVKSCMFVGNKPSVSLLLKYESSIHKIALSSEKEILTEFKEKDAQIKSCLQFCKQW